MPSWVHGKPFQDIQTLLGGPGCQVNSHGKNTRFPLVPNSKPQSCVRFFQRSLNVAPKGPRIVLEETKGTGPTERKAPWQKPLTIDRAKVHAARVHMGVVRLQGHTARGPSVRCCPLREFGYMAYWDTGLNHCKTGTNIQSRICQPKLGDPLQKKNPQHGNGLF